MAERLLMTDYDYAKFAELVGNLKRAAIDAYMYSLEGYSIVNGKYEKTSSDGTFYVSLPGEDGEGGGDSTSNFPLGLGGMLEDWNDHRDDKYYAGKFSEVKNAVDKIVGPWAGLPDPNNIANALRAYRSDVIVNLSADIGDTKLPDPGTKVPGIDAKGEDEQSPEGILPGPIGSYIKGLSVNDSDLKGSAMSVFKKMYFTKLPDVVKNLCFLSNLHAASLLAEQRAFLGARAQVIKMITEATAAFKEVAKGQTGSCEMDSKFLDWAISALSLPASGGIDLAISVTQLILTATKDLQEMQSEAKAEANTYSSLMSQLHNNFSAFAERFEMMERGVHATLMSYSNQLVKADQGRDFDSAVFRLVRGGANSSVTDADDKDQVTLIKEDAVSDVSYYLLKVTYLLNQSAEKLDGVSMSAVVERPGSIGMSQYGPHLGFDDLKQRLCELLRDLNWQVEEGIVNLRLAQADFEQQDAKAQTDLDDLNKTIEEGSGMNPFDDEAQQQTKQHDSRFDEQLHPQDE